MAASEKSKFHQIQQVVLYSFYQGGLNLYRTSSILSFEVKMVMLMSLMEMQEVFKYRTRQSKISFPKINKSRNKVK